MTTVAAQTTVPTPTMRPVPTPTTRPQPQTAAPAAAPDPTQPTLAQIRAAADPSVVANAQAAIDAEFDTSGLADIGITAGEAATAARALMALPADEARATIRQMDANGSLDTLTGELNDNTPGPFRGVSQQSRENFYASMARRLDGESLALLSDSAARTVDGGNEVDAIGRMVAAHAPEAVKADYVQAVLKRDLTDGNVTSAEAPGPGTSLRSDDAEARAVATVLGSMGRGPHGVRAFTAAAADKAALDEISVAAIGKETYRPSNSLVGSVSYEPAAANRMMAAAGGLPDARLKATLFAGMARATREMAAEGAATVESAPDASRARASLARSMTGLLRTDTNGIMDGLQATRRSGGFDGGEGASYAKLMIQADQGVGLGNVLADLQLGNDRQGDAAERFYREELRGGDSPVGHPEAARLGYFVGSVYNAADRLTEDGQASVKATTDMLDVAATAIGLAPNPVVGAAAGMGKTAIQAVLEEASSQVSRQGRVAAEEADAVAVPTNADGRVPVSGSDAESAYGTQVDRVRSVVTRMAQGEL